MIAGIAKKQLTHDRSGKGDGVDIALSGGIAVFLLVQALEDGIDLADDAAERLVVSQKRK